ncbi:hypothetical protein C8R42DRAFT_637272 [Lentinula raphanica]|nr:hypothetical protein C8R42DRAFT_637272 [Lentinula raphanica]
MEEVTPSKSMREASWMVQEPRESTGNCPRYVDNILVIVPDSDKAITSRQERSWGDGEGYILRSSRWIWMIRESSESLKSGLSNEGRWSRIIGMDVKIWMPHHQNWQRRRLHWSMTGARGSPKPKSLDYVLQASFVGCLGTVGVTAYDSQ